MPYAGLYIELKSKGDKSLFLVVNGSKKAIWFKSSEVSFFLPLYKVKLLF